MSDLQQTRRSRHVPWRPAAPLRPYVSTMSAYDFRLGRPGTHRGLPSTRLILVLPVGSPLGVGWHGPGETPRAYWSCLSGLHTTPAEIHYPGQLAGIQLGLTPRAARRLLGRPARDLAGTLVELGEVAPALADLPERLAELASWRERLRLVETSLLRVLTRVPEAQPRPEIGWALRRLSGRSTVAAAAAEVGWSRRHLGDQFRAELGLTPKQYQRIVRFERSHRELVRQARAGRLSLAGVAAGAGFADQAHLTREWAALAGHTPTAWLRSEFPFLQDAIPDPS